MRKIVNNEDLKKINANNILKLLYNTPTGMSRAEIAKLVKCDNMTVGNIINRLFTMEAICSDGFARNDAGRGRPREIIKINPAWRYAAGIEISPEGLTGVLSDFGGKIHYREGIIFDRNINSMDFKKSLLDMVGRIAGKADAGSLLGVAIISYGVLDPETMIAKSAGGLPFLENMDLRKIVGQIPDVDFEIIRHGDAVKALLGSREIYSNAFFVKVGNEVYAVNLSQSQPDKVMEFGHLIIDGKSPATCPCGHCGCVEALASVRALTREFAELHPGRPATFNSVVEAFLEDDAKAVKIVEAAAEALGIALCNLLHFTGTRKIILSGDVLKLGIKYRNVLDKTLNTFAIPAMLNQLSIVEQEQNIESLSEGGALYIFSRLFDR
jgi:predicted NBD/HSP70 family sugar kinase